MASGMLGIGVSGLLAYQRALQTVSHNVSNANTDGYSRQRVEFGTQTPQLLGSSYIGTGVRTQSVERVYDGFLTGQVQGYTSSASHSEVFARHAGLLDELLADPEVGLTPAMEDFFSELQAVANDPSATAPRQSFLTQAETLADRYAYINQRFEDLRGQVNDQVEEVVSEINGFANSIARINRDISLSPGNNPPNDLLDARDRLLNQLAEKVAISTVEQDNGAVNVFIGKGQSLVMNFDAHTIHAVRSEHDVRQFEVGVTGGGGSLVQITSQISGGHLGALFDFREQVLNDAQNSLGALAIGFADTFNAQHRLGQDLNGNLGNDFFSVPALEVRSGRSNSGDAVIGATLTDSGQLSSAEYLLRFNGGSYTLTNTRDGSTESFATLPHTTSHGFSLDIESGAMNNGDSFLVRPGRRGAQDLAVAVNNPSEITAAAPVRSSADIINNNGSGTISQVVVGDTANFQSSPLPPLSGDIVMEFDGSNINVVAGPAPWNGVSFAYSNGAEVTALPDLRFSISGTLSAGDRFSIESNDDGVGDNRNALLLSGLQNQGLLGNGTASYTDFYGGVVADVGVVTRQAQLTQTSQEGLLSQAVNARDSMSGVNLDEEAANLVKFQQAYQAASQVIVAANTMFNSLLSALRG